MPQQLAKLARTVALVGVWNALNYRIGIPTVAISSIVATAVFASLNSSVALPFKLVVGFISVCAAVLSGLQTFMRPAIRAEQHRSVQIDLERLLRDIDALLAFGEQASEKLAEKVENLSGRLAEIQGRATAPTVNDYREVSAYIYTSKSVRREFAESMAAKREESEKLAEKVESLSGRLAEIQVKATAPTVDDYKVADREAAERREAASNEAPESSKTPHPGGARAVD